MNRTEYRELISERLKLSGCEVTKTGGLYQDPKKIVESNKSQKELSIISEIRKRNTV